MLLVWWFVHVFYWDSYLSTACQKSTPPPPPDRLSKQRDSQNNIFIRPNPPRSEVIETPPVHTNAGAKLELLILSLTTTVLLPILLALCFIIRWYRSYREEVFWYLVQAQSFVSYLFKFDGFLCNVCPWTGMLKQSQKRICRTLKKRHLTKLSDCIN